MNTSKITPPEAYLSKSDVARLIGVTTHAIDQWLRRGRFPAADMRLPSGRQRWLRATVETWIADLKAKEGVINV